MQPVSETSTNPRINGPKAATMSRLHSITPTGLLVGGATDPMKGGCECIGLAHAKQEFCAFCFCGVNAKKNPGDCDCSATRAGRCLALYATKSHALGMEP